MHIQYFLDRFCALWFKETRCYSLRSLQSLRYSGSYGIVGIFQSSFRKHSSGFASSKINSKIKIKSTPSKTVSSFEYINDFECYLTKMKAGKRTSSTADGQMSIIPEIKTIRSDRIWTASIINRRTVAIPEKEFVTPSNAQVAYLVG